MGRLHSEQAIPYELAEMPEDRRVVGKKPGQRIEFWFGLYTQCLFDLTLPVFQSPLPTVHV